MGIMVYSLLWVMQDFVHQPHYGNPYRIPWIPSPINMGPYGLILIPYG